MENRVSLKEAIDKIEYRESVDILPISITGDKEAFTMGLYKSANGPAPGPSFNFRRFFIIEGAPFFRQEVEKGQISRESVRINDVRN